MATQANLMDNQNHCHTTKRISWSAVLTGALIGVGLSFLLNLFGVAIGLSAFSMSEHGVETLAVGGLLGFIVSTIVAMFFAGYTAGYIGRLYVPKHNMGMIYGFTTWTVAVILSAVLTSHIGSYIDTYSTSVSRNTIVLTQAPAVTNKPATENQQKITAVIQKEISSGIAIGAFVVFALFFLGAFSSCLGAHFGMSCKSKE